MLTPNLLNVCEYSVAFYDQMGRLSLSGTVNGRRFIHSSRCRSVEIFSNNQRKGSETRRACTTGTVHSPTKERRDAQMVVAETSGETSGTGY
jgi:hypothetical protein